MTTVVRLQQPFLDDGIESVKFFNGRLLSAEDLEHEQIAQQRSRALLGEAVGDGVARGFDVRVARGLGDPYLRVTAGLAVNLEGEPVQLTQDVELDLRDNPTAAPAVTSGAGAFHTCLPPGTGLYTAGRELWLLLVAPAEGTRGRAPVTGLGNSTTACNAKYRVDGVRFRLVAVSDAVTPADRAVTAAAERKLQSVVASRCFDVPNALAQVADPAGAPASARLVEALRAAGTIAPCEVPLALFFWSATPVLSPAVPAGFQFIDRWAVRRRVARRGADAPWHAAPSDAARAEAEAMLRQFHEQAEGIPAPQRANATARERFAWLPPAGVLPMALADGTPGFSVERFFQGMTHRASVGTIPGPRSIPAYTVIEGSRARGLLDEALAHPPVGTGTDEMFWVYQVRENLQAAQAPGSRVQPYVIFTRGAVPYRGHAQFDLSHWGYATFV